MADCCVGPRSEQRDREKDNWVALMASGRHHMGLSFLILFSQDEDTVILVSLWRQITNIYFIRIIGRPSIGRTDVVGRSEKRYRSIKKTNKLRSLWS